MNKKTADFITELVVWWETGALSCPSVHLNLTINIIGFIIVPYDMNKSEK